MRADAGDVRARLVTQQRLDDRRVVVVLRLGHQLGALGRCAAVLLLVRCKAVTTTHTVTLHTR